MQHGALILRRRRVRAAKVPRIRAQKIVGRCAELGKSWEDAQAPEGSRACFDLQTAFVISYCTSRECVAQSPDARLTLMNVTSPSTYLLYSSSGPAVSRDSDVASSRPLTTRDPSLTVCTLDLSKMLLKTVL